MKKTKVIVQISTDNTDSEGFIQQSWSDAATIYAVELPITNDLALKYWGYQDKVEKRIFYKGYNANIVKGNRVLIDDVPLFIVSVLDYGKVMDMLLNNSMPGGGGSG